MPSGLRSNGLVEKTFFYPAILLRTEYAALPPHAGILGNTATAELRSALRTALGIGTGSCDTPGAPAGSRRGRIVTLVREFAQAVRSPLAVVLTQHRYSREQNYHVLLPLIRGDGKVAGETIVTLHERPWFAAFREPTTRVYVPIQVVQSAWYRDDVVAETRYVLDDASLRVIDSALCRYFGLDDETSELTE
jgi:hypothetical protein